MEVLTVSPVGVGLIHHQVPKLDTLSPLQSVVLTYGMTSVILEFNATTATLILEEAGQHIIKTSWRKSAK